MPLIESRQPDQVIMIQGKTEIIFNIVVSETAGIVLALGEYVVDKPCIGLLATDKLFCDSSVVWPTGFGLRGLVPKNDVVTVKLQRPLIGIGQSYSINLPIIAYR